MSLDLASFYRQLSYDPDTGVFRWKVVRRGYFDKKDDARAAFAAAAIKYFGEFARVT